MSFYDKMEVKTLINASETYTKLGGSLMDTRTLMAMEEAGRAFVDMEELTDSVCRRAAGLTRNDAALVTTGAAGGLVLAAAACMLLGGCRETAHGEEPSELFPRGECFRRNEILMFDGKYREIIPYWKLTALTGARIVPVAPREDAVREAVSSRTAGFFLFPSSLYEEGIMNCREAIPLLKALKVRVVVDAAAQLPPRSNLWYYTKELGADLVIFSGGKHIRGPQSTGLMAGSPELIDAARTLTCPNARIGRGFKTGKEELAGFLTALELFLETDEAEDYRRQEKILRHIGSELSGRGLEARMEREGRLGTRQPLLTVLLPDGCSGEECNRFTRCCVPAVDVGVYGPEFGRPENMIFLNAYNLKEEEAEPVAGAVCAYLTARAGKEC